MSDRDLIRPIKQGVYFGNSWEGFISYCLGSVRADGMYLELGVGTGRTTKYIAPKVKDILFGFDSFLGLPEDWHRSTDVVKAGHYSMHGEPPRLPPNVVVMPGLFEDSLPHFLHHKKDKCAFIHVDVSLYKSCKTVLDNLGDRLTIGTVVCFNSLYGPDLMIWDEMKAFLEFVEATKIGYKWIAWMESPKAAILITSCGQEQSRHSQERSES